MDRPQTHFELFVRRKVNSSWTLEQATEDRARVVSMGEDMLREGQVVAFKVTKETLDPETRAFRSILVTSKGAMGPKSKETAEADNAPLCVAPQDLYTVHARERIAELLEGWLRRKVVTPFEVLHRPDLVEQLEASGVEILHAIQKIAVPEAQARGVTTHEMVRSYQKLVARGIERLLKDGRRKLFPNVAGPQFAKAAEALTEESERFYILAGGVAEQLATAKNWAQKISLVLDMADAAAPAGRARALCLGVLEQPLSEILALTKGLTALVGEELDLGAQLIACANIAAGAQVKMLLSIDPGLKNHIPALTNEGARLAQWMQQGAFNEVRASLGRSIAAELQGARRLRPSNPQGEIALLRALAMILTASAPTLMSHDDVTAAFLQRSKTLISADFVEAYLKGRQTAFSEVEGLIWLAENVAGAVNKRAAARWIDGAVSSLRFEKEVRADPASPAAKLADLAKLQRGVRKAGLGEAEEKLLFGKIGEVGALVEADAKLLTLLVRSQSPLATRLSLLLRFASAEVGPSGPVAERARAEVVKLMRDPSTKVQLSADPGAIDRVKAMLQDAGLAA